MQRESDSLSPVDTGRHTQTNVTGRRLWPRRTRFNCSFVTPTSQSGLREWVNCTRSRQSNVGSPARLFQQRNPAEWHQAGRLIDAPRPHGHCRRDVVQVRQGYQLSRRQRSRAVTGTDCSSDCLGRQCPQHRGAQAEFAWRQTVQCFAALAAGRQQVH